MKIRPKHATVPRDRDETERHRIVTLLQAESLPTREISIRIRISEKEVLDHLEHIRMGRYGTLVMEPAACRACGFVFKKRDRLKGPGRCPVCHSEQIAEPLFTIG
ncbi:transcriptional regulator [Geomesophilobacter sediminis]|uniref:Transcriptional regulator n=1 Tax=Geomesophilobacter sediminis TaxID=2798584 RepID=A0A8J7M1H3_9BACT|nr:transcriptional regulator [Geomesophilobacter sediminis]MBJ6726960.1 transcriptional regulator [Geomesophilobacter sediminis]